MSEHPKSMAVQGAALIMAGVLLLLGVLSFIPGVTSDLGELGWVGQHSGARRICACPWQRQCDHPGRRQPNQ